MNICNWTTRTQILYYSGSDNLFKSDLMLHESPVTLMHVMPRWQDDPGSGPERPQLHPHIFLDVFRSYLQALDLSEASPYAISPITRIDRLGGSHKTFITQQLAGTQMTRTSSRSLRPLQRKQIGSQMAQSLLWILGGNLEPPHSPACTATVPTRVVRCEFLVTLPAGELGNFERDPTLLSFSMSEALFKTRLGTIQRLLFSHYLKRLGRANGCSLVGDIRGGA